MQLSLLGGDFWWTSGTDQGREDRYVWMGSLAAVGDFIWFQNEPAGGTENNCLCLSRDHGYFADDCPCNLSTTVICQKVTSHPVSPSTAGPPTRAAEGPCHLLPIKNKHSPPD